MFKSEAHRMAGHAAAAKSKKTPQHLRIHQQRLAMGKVQKNMPRLQTAPLGTPESSVAQPKVVTPLPETKVRFFQKPVPTVGGKAVTAPKPKAKKGPMASQKMAFPVGKPVPTGKTPRPMPAFYGGM